MDAQSAQQFARLRVMSAVVFRQRPWWLFKTGAGGGRNVFYKFVWRKKNNHCSYAAFLQRNTAQWLSAGA
jgi:hypothetical protein